MTIIYKYTNRVNGKVYVGKTDFSFRVRHNDHICRARLGRRTPWYSAIRKYGIESFDHEILVEVDSEFGNLVEMIFIAGCKANDRRFGYNSTDGGEGALGNKLSEETIARLRVIQQNRPFKRLSPEHRANIGKTLIGNGRAAGAVRSQKFRDNLSHIQQGKKMSAEATLKRLISRYGPDYKPKGYAGRWARKKLRREQRAAAAGSG